MGEVKFVDYAGFTNQNNHQMLVQQVQDGRYETVYPAKFATKNRFIPSNGSNMIDQARAQQTAAPLQACQQLPGELRI